MQVEIAERVGIDRSFLADVERGNRKYLDFEPGTHCELVAKITLSCLFSRL